jgi:hypothetical protein
MSDYEIFSPSLDATWGKHPRVFFTDEMAEAILAGRKTMTTRDHQWGLGLKEACKGTWRKPKTIQPFAIIRILSNAEVKWPYPTEHWREEGFESLNGILLFLKTHPHFGYDKAPHIYSHIFERVA